MAGTLKKCSECERFFSAPEGVDKCHACRDSPGQHDHTAVVEYAVHVRGHSTVAEIVATTGLAKEDVLRVVQASPSIAANVDTADTCPQCGNRPIVPGRDLCHVCIVGLEADLKDHRDAVSQNLIARGERPESRLHKQSVGAALRDKRRRTGTHRFNPVPRNIKRGN